MDVNIYSLCGDNLLLQFYFVKNILVRPNTKCNKLPFEKEWAQ